MGLRYSAFPKILRERWLSMGASAPVPEMPASWNTDAVLTLKLLVCVNIIAARSGRIAWLSRGVTTIQMICSYQCILICKR
ncbi:hypothetical protein FIBSPDRAFT_510786 [Athelia psychrophila]|uniref:Uncharacterized protein n=1 Tax=Athelia psychrophila TaxID=1759441 RepID=A0A166UYR9_9AGAM|nr:hypothetical protein FIBSPDRAFT_510786 [Fibularhizoctonia sp. CBS 109695]